MQLFGQKKSLKSKINYSTSVMASKFQKVTFEGIKFTS